MPLHLRQIVPVQVGRKYEENDGRTTTTANTTSAGGTSRFSDHRLSGDDGRAANCRGSLTLNAEDHYADYVCRQSRLLVDTKEEATNRVMANIIRQLASLGRNASEMFEVLEEEASRLSQRLSALGPRISAVDAAMNNKTDLEALAPAVVGDNSQNKVIQGDGETKDGGNVSSATNAVWRSRFDCGAGLFTKESRPKPVQDAYSRCQKVPRLDLLQEFREDGQDCAKMYSDPEMFFEIWRADIIQSMQQQRQQQLQQLLASRKGNRLKQNSNRDRNKAKIKKIKPFWERMQEKERLAGNLKALDPERTSAKKRPGGDPSPRQPETTSDSSGGPFEVGTKQNRQEVPEVPAPMILEDDEEDFDFPAPPCFDDDGFQGNFRNQQGRPFSCESLPSPPADPLRPPPAFDLETQSEAALPGLPLNPAPAPPPPPPPPPLSTGPSTPGTKVVHNSSKVAQEMKRQLKPVINQSSSDDRSELLLQIRQGKQLRKVTPEMIEEDRKAASASGSGNGQGPRAMVSVAEVMAAYMESRFQAVHGSFDDENDLSGYTDSD